MSKKFQPGAKNRQKYIYYTADGTTITIEAGENGVDEKWIAKLHELDDKEYLAAKREDYAAPVRLGKESVDDLKNQLDQNPRNSIKACLDKRKFSLAKLYPELAKEWNYDKNSPMKPAQFAPHANEKVWWKCNDCGNEWIAAIGDRTRPDATGCPQCALKNGAEKRVSSIIANKGSAADLAEDVLLDWDYSRNTFLPSEITKGSSKKVAWKCHVCGYEWESTISKKLRGNSCSACSNRVVIVGRNDLATLRPDLLKDWDYSKNTIKPDEVTLGTGKRAYWKCHICGYEWSAVIGSRVKGAGCSNCYRMRRRKLQK